MGYMSLLGPVGGISTTITNEICRRESQLLMVGQVAPRKKTVLLKILQIDHSVHKKNPPYKLATVRMYIVLHAKRQKQDDVWDNLGRTTNLNSMAPALQYSYTNLSLLFVRYHKNANFVL
jgi:hypothetical protein